MNSKQFTGITYDKAFVAFLDVLGFKNMINGDLNKINQYFKIVGSEINKLKGMQSKEDIGAIVISDSIILTVPCSEDNEENISNLRQLCIAVGQIQQRLAIEDVWLRGAISYGDTYFNVEQNQIVGPAYVSAYLLEQQLAINPRIILDVKLVHQLNLVNAYGLITRVNDQLLGGLKDSNWGSKILFDSTFLGDVEKNNISNETPLFIDYLSPLVESKNWEDLKKVVNNVKNNMYSDSRIYKKFRWVADYVRALYSIEFEETGIDHLEFVPLVIDL